MKPQNIEDDDLCLTHIRTHSKIYPYEESGPYHDFILLNENDFPLKKYNDTHCIFYEKKNNDDSVFRHTASLSDDFLLYVEDQIRWIPTIDPVQNNKPIKGLHTYGCTAIDLTGAEVAKNYFGSLANLLEQGPDPLPLTGPNVCICNDDGIELKDTEMATEILYSKSVLISNLRKLESFSDTVISASEKFYILHFGI